MVRAIDVRLKLHSFFGKLSDIAKRKNLKASAIGQNGFVPSVKFVQAAGFFKHLHTRP